MANKQGSPAAEQLYYISSATPSDTDVVVGSLYVDKDDGKVYRCTSLSPITFTEVAGGADHNVLSATHLDSSAAAALRGAMLIGNSTPAWSRLAVGAANRLLRSDGTDPSWGQGTFANYLSDVQFIKKTVDEIVNNSDTLQNDDALLFAVGANETWVFLLLTEVFSAAAADWKITFTGPTGSAGNFGPAWGSGTPLSTALGTSLSVGTNGASRNVPMLWGTIRNGGTAGNLQLQWAQVVATASDTTVYGGGILLGFKVA